MQKAGICHPLPSQPVLLDWPFLPGWWLLGRRSQSERLCFVYFNTGPLDHGPCLPGPFKGGLSGSHCQASFFVIDHSKECHFHPNHRFPVRVDPRRAYGIWQKGAPLLSRVIKSRRVGGRRACFSVYLNPRVPLSWCCISRRPALST